MHLERSSITIHVKATRLTPLRSGYDPMTSTSIDELSQQFMEARFAKALRLFFALSSNNERFALTLNRRGAESQVLLHSSEIPDPIVRFDLAQ